MVISLLAGPLLPAAWAKEPAAPQLTLKDAIQKALSSSEDVKAQEYAAEKAEEQRKDALDAVDFIPAPLSASPQGDVAWSSFMKADYNWQIQKKKLEASKDKVTQAVVQAYYDVIYKNESLKNAQAALARDEKALQVARAVYAAGGIPSTTASTGGIPPGTRASLLAAEAKAQDSRKAVESAKAELDKAYITFNRLVGLWPEDRPVLTEPLTFAPLKIDSVDAEAERAVESSKEIDIKEKLKDIAKVDVDYPYTLSTSGFVWQELDITGPEVNIKEQDIAKAKNDTRQNLRTLYNDIRALEEKYAALQDALRAAEEGLRITRALYDAGMTTQDKVAEAEASYTDLRTKLVGLTAQHTVQLASFCLMTGRPVTDGSFLDAVVDKGSAQVITAGDARTEAGNVAVFRIGEAKYSLNGREISMDIAPVGEDFRAFLPLRYAANALGVPDTGITWDAESRKVTLVKGDRRVEVTVGSRELLLNGSAVTMDVAPKISNGRVMLPVSFLAKALNADVQWDSATQTVTIKY
ncbi:MAG TPA: TolC family protein [Syntrophomonadaceae bacterium]|nr:TolC family protein [Syntrophomonadaceae bacterium]